jgi:predicted alpha/beta-fold hydrolase
MDKFGQPGVPAASARPADAGAARHGPLTANDRAGELATLFGTVAEPDFRPARWLANRHAQTIWPNRIKRHPAGARLAAAAKPAIIESEDGDALRLYWSCHEGDEAGRAQAPGYGRRAAGEPGAGESGELGAGVPRVGEPGELEAGRERRPPRPVLVILHGLTGGADAENVMAMGAKGHELGFEVVRVDLRNSQATGTPSLGIGHAGRSEDLRATLRHVAERRPGAPTAVVGFSLGGNIALKAAGEYGERAPAELRAVAAISVPIDLDHACTAIDSRPENWIYRTYFLRRLGRRYLRARAARPDLFPAVDVDRIRGIRAWDDAVVAPLGGFADAGDYYARNSSLRVIDRIRVPTLLVHAQDDPFIPFDPFASPAVRDNHWLHLLAPARGGHVGFFAAPGVDGEPDRYWAENRALAFCAAACGLLPAPAVAGPTAVPEIEWIQETSMTGSSHR